MPKKELTEQQEVEQDLKKYKALGVMVDSEGGQIAIKELTSIIVNDLDSVLIGYNDLPEVELRARLASIRANTGLIKYMKKAKSNVKVLEEIVKEFTLQEDEY